MAKLSIIGFILLFSIVSRINSQATENCVQVISLKTANKQDAGTDATVSLHLFDSSDYNSEPFAIIYNLTNYGIKKSNKQSDFPLSFPTDTSLIDHETFAPLTFGPSDPRTFERMGAPNRPPSDLSKGAYFERGNTDTFTVSTECRKACKIVLRHDNTNVAAGWLVNSLNITLFQSSVPVVLPLVPLPTGSEGSCTTSAFNFGAAERNTVVDDDGERGAWLASDVATTYIIIDNCGVQPSTVSSTVSSITGET